MSTPDITCAPELVAFLAWLRSLSEHEADAAAQVVSDCHFDRLIASLPPVDFKLETTGL